VVIPGDIENYQKKYKITSIIKA